MTRKYRSRICRLCEKPGAQTKEGSGAYIHKGCGRLATARFNSGLCTDCGEPAVSGNAVCARCENFPTKIGYPPALDRHEYMRKYTSRPEVKEKRREYIHRPEVKKVRNERDRKRRLVEKLSNEKRARAVYDSGLYRDVPFEEWKKKLLEILQ